MTEETVDQTPTQQPRIKTTASRLPRYAVAQKCRCDYAQYIWGVMEQRLSGSKRRIGEAIAVAVAISPSGQEEDEQGRRLLASLASVGVTIDALNAAGEVRVRIEPAALHKAYERLPRKEPHTFTCGFAVNGFEDHDVTPLADALAESRYPSGLSEQDELRMQVEILRQPLGDLGITVNEALDELCAGLQSPCEQTRTRCNAIVVALEQYGLQFHAVRKSWRLPRAGVLLIERPGDLMRACPALAFFEPWQSRHLVVVDRPERAGGEVRQGLLF